MKQIDRDALKEWEALKQSIYNDTPIDETMSQIGRASCRERV